MYRLRVFRPLQQLEGLALHIIGHISVLQSQLEGLKYDGQPRRDVSLGLDREHVLYIGPGAILVAALRRYCVAEAADVVAASPIAVREADKDRVVAIYSRHDIESER